MLLPVAGRQRSLLEFYLFPVIATVSFVISVFSAVLCGLSVRGRFKQKNAPALSDGKTAVVIGIPGRATPDGATLKAIAESDHQGSRVLVTGRLPFNDHAAAAIRKLKREYPVFDVLDVTAEPERRHVSPTSLAVAAWKSVSEGRAIIMQYGTRPSTPVIRRLSVDCSFGAVCTAVPVRPRQNSGKLSAASDVARLSPVTFVLFGPSGICPALVVTGPEFAREVADDPLTLNRSSFGAALLASVAPNNFFWIDEPAAIDDDTAGLHLKILAKINPARYFLMCLSLLAGPLALGLSAASFFVAGGGGLIALLSLLVSIGSRIASGLTWPVAVSDTGTVIVDAVISPVSDGVALVRALIAAGKSRHQSKGADFELRKGGLMVPAGPGLPEV